MSSSGRDIFFTPARSFSLSFSSAREKPFSSALPSPASAASSGELSSPSPAPTSVEPGLDRPLPPLAWLPAGETFFSAAAAG